MPEISLLPTSIASKIEVQSSGCWHWSAALNDAGYGVYKWKGKQHKAHRLVYELLVAPIPSALDLDHECHNPKSCSGGSECLHRRCVNPSHTSPKSRKENLARGCQDGRDLQSMRNWALARTHCAYGHEWRPETTRIPKDGVRRCMICELIRYWVPREA